jgi:protein-L-isoaspartate O-methyltransferase
LEAQVPGTAAAPSRRNGTAPLEKRLVELLDLQPEDLVVGVGTYSSRYCLAMLEQVLLRHQIILVEASTQRLDRLASVPRVRLSSMSALEFARFPAQWDKILLDDSLVAEDGDGADELLRLLLTRLQPAGRMIAVPCASARTRSAALQRSTALASRVRDSGFEVSFDATQPGSDSYGLVVGVKPILV